jgi:hypothetical protein
MVELRGKLKQPTTFDTIEQMIAIAENGHMLAPETLPLSNIKKHVSALLETMEKENVLGTRDTVFSFDVGLFHYTMDLVIARAYVTPNNPRWPSSNMTSWEEASTLAERRGV